MAKPQLTKDQIRKFCLKFAGKYLDKSPEQLLEQLLNDGLLETDRLRNELLSLDHQSLSIDTTATQSIIFEQLADKYGLSARQVQNIIYRHKCRKRQFKPLP